MALACRAFVYFPRSTAQKNERLSLQQSLFSWWCTRKGKLQLNEYRERTKFSIEKREPKTSPKMNAEELQRHGTTIPVTRQEATEYNKSCRTQKRTHHEDFALGHPAWRKSGSFTSEISWWVRESLGKLDVELILFLARSRQFWRSGFIKIEFK